ncbi:hypothetical protein Tco_0306487, partial [Tanacetum coccineum]
CRDMFVVHIEHGEMGTPKISGLRDQRLETTDTKVSWISGDVQNNQFDLCATDTDFRDARVLRI